MVLGPAEAPCARRPFNFATCLVRQYMWQSRVENNYSVTYFNHTRAFKAVYLRTSVKGGARTGCVEASHIDAMDTTTQCV